MDEYKKLLATAKDTVHQAMEILTSIRSDTHQFSFCEDLPREMKAAADQLIETSILENLRLTNIGILSEESGEEGIQNDNSLRWIVDPLDGTVNFVRGIGPCAISVALWKGSTPIFGVIGEYPSRNIFWGGEVFGAFVNDAVIKVSGSCNVGQSVLCTGFPSRYNFSTTSTAELIKIFSRYGKVRMLGAASLSLIQVARGSAESYLEDEIMIWDVAAGLAIVEGAGGEFQLSPGRVRHSCSVFASNRLINR